MKTPKLLSSILLIAALVGNLSAEESFKPIFNGKSLDGWKSAHSKGAGDWGPFGIDETGRAIHVHGDLTNVWPLSMEMQIGETPADRFGKDRFHVGDLFLLGKNLRCKTTKTNGRYDPQGPLVESSHCPTTLGVERPKGEWNEVEIVVDGAKKVTFKLNGEVVHEIQDLEQKVGGKWVPLDKGRIALQAEWAELLYRNVRIKEPQ